MPALLTSRSSRPKASSVRANSALTDSGSLTSAVTTSERASVAAPSRATASSGSRRRPASTTEKPPCMSARATCLPMPVPAPVTRAIFSGKGMAGLLFTTGEGHAAAQLKSLQHRARIGDTLTRNVKRRAMRRCQDGKRQATLHGNATPKAHEFHGDLALVVVHGDHGVVLAPLALHFQEDRIRREGALDRDPARARRFHRGTDDVDFFPAERSVVTVVRVQAADRDARMGDTAAQQFAVDQFHALCHAFVRDLVRHLAMSNVRGHARSPQTIEDIELANRPVETELFDEPVQLVAGVH